MSVPNYNIPYYPLKTEAEKEEIRIRSRRLAKDPVWLNNVRQAAKRWSSDPEWIEAQAKRNADLISRPDWPEIHARAT